MSFKIGSLNTLVSLYKASTIDLIRNFKAKKIDDKYLIDVKYIPWLTIYEFDQEYPVIQENRVLTIKNIKLSIEKIPAGIELIIGCLVNIDNEFYVLGTLLTYRKSTFKCIIKPLTNPPDLWDFPKIIQIPKIQLVLNDQEFKNCINIRIPIECIQHTSLIERLYLLKTKYLCFIVNLISAIEKIEVNLSNIEICYT